MAMEDAYSLAACLHVAGKQNVALATKVHNKLRYADMDRGETSATNLEIVGSSECPARRS